MSEKEYRFLLNNMLFQLDSESIFEMMEDFPDFLIGTSIRGEGKMASPVLFNIIRVMNTKKVKREHIKEYVKVKMDEDKKVNFGEKSKEETSKRKLKKLKGSLGFVMGYIERYNMIKILEEEGVKGVKKIKTFLEEDSMFVGYSRRSKTHYFVDEMKRFEKSLLQKRAKPVRT
jgi:hypothetical protein